MVTAEANQTMPNGPYYLGTPCVFWGLSSVFFFFVCRHRTYARYLDR